MMNGIILRVFLGLIISLMLVVGFCYSYWSYTSSEEGKSYREQLISSLLRLADQNVSLSSLTSMAQKKEYFLSLRKEFAVDLRFIEDARTLSDVLIDELQAPGHVYLHQAMDGLYWEGMMRSTSSTVDQYFLLRLSQFEEREAKMLGLLASSFYQHWSAKETRPAALARLKSIVGFPVFLLKAEEAKLGQEATSRLLSKQSVVVFDDSLNDTLTLRVVIPTQTEAYLVLYPLLGEDSGFPWVAAAYFVLLAFMVMAVLTYWILISFFQRIFRIEEAALGIRRHDFGSRVPIEGNDVLSRLATAFNEMADHIQRLISSQKEMTNAVSHELRTPIARIRFGLEMLETASSEEKRFHQLTGMDNDIQELEKLIDELLTYAVLEQGMPSLHLEMIDVDSVIARVKREMDQMGKAIQIEHAVFKGPKDSRFAECEQRYIHRAIQNLVGNAIKYAKGKIRISCLSQGGMIRVDVEDDGPGIPQDKWAKVFVPFARLDSSRTRSSGGYGLGLSIVQRIVFWHGGIAQAWKSNALGGARFTMIWPRHQQVRASSERKTI